MAKKRSKDIPDQDDRHDQDVKETHDLFISPESPEKIEAEDTDIDQDLAPAQKFDTQHSDGHTYDPREAIEQGLTYTPPSDPAVLPSEDEPQGVEVAAGFAPTMEESDPEARDLPPSVDNSDLDLQDGIYQLLRTKSETAHLTNIDVTVENGVVDLRGTVSSQDDLTYVDNIVNSLTGVVQVRNHLQVES